MPKSPAGYLHLAGACCVGQATEILCSWALQGKQLLQAVWSCLYTELPWKSPGPTALHIPISRVYFSRTWFVSHLTWPGVGRKSWMRFWGGCGLQTDLCGSSLDASKSRWSNGIPAVNSKNIFLRWIWGKVGLSKKKLITNSCTCMERITYNCIYVYNK